MSQCSHDCSNCSSKDCAEKKDFREKQNELSNIKKVIGIVSGKGGVGKSLVTSLLSVLSQRKGYKTRYKIWYLRFGSQIYTIHGTK